MKVQAGAVEGFLARPPEAVFLVLVYGPDAGLASERARRLVAAVVPDPGDPFRVSDLDALTADDPPRRLAEEARALALTGGRRVVRVRNAGDRLTSACEDVLRIDDPPALVVLEAGELASRSSLRRLAEASPAAAAISCYHDTAQGLPGVVRGLLARNGLRVEPEAFDLLLQQLGGDRGQTASEIDKLALYVADRPERPVTRADVVAAVGDGSVLEIEGLVIATLGGDTRTLERTLDRLLEAGTDPGRILRACAGTVARALRIKADIAAGKPRGPALAAIFFRQRPVIERLVDRWPTGDLAGALGLLQDAETRCRFTRDLAAEIAEQALQKLARSAGHRP